MSLRIRLLIIFLSISIIPIIFLGSLNLSNMRAILKDDRIAELETIVTLKKKTIEEFYKYLKQDIVIAQDYYNIKQNLPIMTRLAGDRTNPEYIVVQKMLDDQLKIWVETKKELIDFMLTNSTGVVVYSANEVHAVQDYNKPLVDPDGKAFIEGKKGVYITDIFRNKAEDFKPFVLVTAPIHDFNEKFIGVIALEVDMSPIYALIQDATGLGQTGETLIGKKIGNEALFLNPLRHDKSAALKRKVIFGGRNAIPIQKAVQGESGSGISKDYRGKEVIAAWQYIPFLDWGLVAKMDVKEAFVGVDQIKKLSIIVGVIAVFFIAMIIFVTSKSLTDSLEKLVEATGQIGTGNLDIKVEIKTDDEIGQLAHSFNQMIENLKKTTTSVANLNKEISDRIKTEQRLEESEEKFRSISSSAMDAIIMMDDKTNISYWNKAAEDIFGYEADEALGKNMHALIAPRCYREEAEKNMPKFAKTGQGAIINHTRELIALKKNGTEFPIELSVSAVNIKGKWHAIGMVRDISQRRESEKLIREMAILPELNPGPVLKIDAHGTILLANTNAQEIFKHQNLIGTSLLSLPAGLDQETLSLLVRKEGIQHREVRIGDQDILFTYKSDIHFEQVGVFGIDVTELRKTTEELRLRSNALEATANAVVITDSAGLIEWVNQAFTVLTGYIKKEVIGRNPRLLKSGKHPPEFYRKIWQVIKSGRVWKGEIINRRKDGTLYPEDQVITPVKNEQGKIVHFIAVKQDVTDKRKIESELRAEKEKALQAVEAKSNFLANITHEIRTPMNVILGFANLLSRTSLSGQQNKYISTIQSSGEMLLGMINDVLDFSKFESAKKVSLEAINFNLEYLINDAFQIIKSHTAQNNVETYIDISDDIPRFLNGDPIRLKQILVNLLSNAQKFTSKGEIGVTVCLEQSSDGEGSRSCSKVSAQTDAESVSGKSDDVNIRFTVKDTGIGISQEAQDSIFEAFSQADGSITRKYGGTGLGLAICRTIVNAIGGRIWVESEKGKGSEFIFILNLKKGEAIDLKEESKSAADELKEKKAIVSCRGIKVLVVEDSVTNQQLIQAYFEECGCEGEYVKNGIEAIQKLKSNKYDLCLMDLQMPDMGGVEATEIIRKDISKDIPIIALTAATLMEDRERAKRAGMTDFLSKPIELETLREKILQHGRKK